MTISPFRFLLLAGVIAGSFSPASAASIDQDTVGDKRARIVVNSFGNCVRTKWEADNDKCAPEPPPAPAPVAQPAPPPPPAPAPISREELTIYFDFDKASLTPEAQAKLNHVGEVINSWKSINKVSIVGYTDEIGTNDYNEKLSMQRAKNVEAYLDRISRIDTSVKGVEAFGENNPVVKCDDTLKREEKIACLAKNRRVEVQFEYQK